ncbi:zinc-binding alcohol dehydrogenase family protein [Legionella sp. W05-934-2]|jgi:zinc-binding alcohol dehydrogenase family protein|uniref:zinc-binding alcohol dehydrogenase family protein n=1 Tax=Legionella sp. W05-934-2 TaxID=1198649 RepID=UPI003461A8FB
MKAIVYKQHPNGQFGFESIEKETPRATGHDLLVDISAISINPVDYKVKRLLEMGKYANDTFGFDASGTVKAVGEKVTLFKPGDKVFYAGDLTRPGSYAQSQLVDERIVGLAPKSLNFEQAAALPLTSLTAWEMIFDRLKLSAESNQTVLVTGAAGGVGSITLQLLKKLTHCTIIATYGREESKGWIKQLGSDHLINHTMDFNPQLQKLNIKHVDVIFSLTHTDDYFKQYVDILAPQGQLIFIDEPKQFDLLAFKSKSAAVHMEFMFTRSMYQTADMIKQHDILTKIADLIDKQLIHTTMNESFGDVSVANIERAHELLESCQSRGKIVLNYR